MAPEFLFGAPEGSWVQTGTGGFVGADGHRRVRGSGRASAGSWEHAGFARGKGEGKGKKVSPAGSSSLGSSEQKNTTQLYSSLVYVSFYDTKVYLLIS